MASVFTEKEVKVPWKAAALPRWIATEILWNKNDFLRCSPVVLDIFFCNLRKEAGTFTTNWTKRFYCNWNKMVRSRGTRVFSLLPVLRRFRYSFRTMNWECKVWWGQSVTDCGIPSEASTGAPRDKWNVWSGLVWSETLLWMTSGLDVWSETLLHPVLIYIAPYYYIILLFYLLFICFRYQV